TERRKELTKRFPEFIKKTKNKSYNFYWENKEDNIDSKVLGEIIVKVNKKEIDDWKKNIRIQCSLLNEELENKKNQLIIKKIEEEIKTLTIEKENLKKEEKYQNALLKAEEIIRKQKEIIISTNRLKGGADEMNLDQLHSKYKKDLIDSISDNNLEIVKILANSVNLNQLIENETPLHLAIEKENLEIVKTLLDNDADVNMQNKDSKTPLHLAIEKENLEIVKELLNIKEINIENIETNEIKNQEIKEIIISTNRLRGGADEMNLDQLHSKYKKDLIDSISDNNLEIVKILANSVNLNQLIENETPLHLAIEKENLEIVKTLLDNDADVNMQNKDSKTPLHLAIEKENLEIVKELLNIKEINIENIETNEIKNQEIKKVIKETQEKQKQEKENKSIKIKKAIPKNKPKTDFIQENIKKVSQVEAKNKGAIPKGTTIERTYCKPFEETQKKKDDDFDKDGASGFSQLPNISTTETKKSTAPSTPKSNKGEIKSSSGKYHSKKNSNEIITDKQLLFEKNHQEIFKKIKELKLEKQNELQKLQTINSQNWTQVKNEIFEQPKPKIVKIKELEKEKWEDNFDFFLPDVPTNELKKTTIKQKNKSIEAQLAMKS
uniref:ankyrin repeat domain-containing protein n=1 Tax=Spiroplasma endosymbiont of Lariophagus distinguendus TaxID=2935082 RepID=UPI0020799703